jgi:hypothetical protein
MSARPIWETAPKPWTEEICRRRYVEGDGISLREIAIESGVSFGVLKNWSRGGKHTKRNVPWPVQREQWVSNLRQKTADKSAERISDKFAQANEAMVEEHIKDWRRSREIVSQYLAAVKVKLASISGASVDPSKIEIAEKTLDFMKSVAGRTSLLTCASVLGQAVDGERKAAYLDLANPDILAKYANLNGLKLVFDETGEEVQVDSGD